MICNFKYKFKINASQGSTTQIMAYNSTATLRRLLITPLFFLGLFFQVWQNVFIYGQNTGFKYIKNYSTGLHPQNWSFVQDKRGMIYVANNGGVREFDGVSWRLINVPNWKVRSLAKDENGTIYLGGVNEIGCLAPDANKSLHYVSLLKHLQDDQKNFSTVWRVNAAQDGIYFRASNFLFRWNPDSRHMKVWKPKRLFNASFSINGKLLIHQRNIGLMHMDPTNDSLILIPGHETFAAVKIYMIVPYDSTAKKLLIGTRSRGFYIYDWDSQITRAFPTEVDDYVKKNELYHGRRLSTGEFALATLNGGLVIIDSNGKLKKIFTNDSGLQDDSVRYVFEDLQGNLWLALDRGIAKIEYASPISIYDSKRSNLPGLVLSVIRHGPRGDLYAGTTRGLYWLASPEKGKFRPVPGIAGNCWSLLSTGDSLLAATSYGVFQVNNNIKNQINIIQMVIADPSNVLHQSKRNKNRVWMGTRQGLVSLYIKKPNNQWEKERKFKNISQEINTIVEDKKGNLWLGIPPNGILKVEFPVNRTNEINGFKRAIDHPVLTKYNTSHGLPTGWVNVSRAAAHVMFATEKGLFRFHEVNRRFIPDTSLGAEFANGSRNVFWLAEDKHKNIWFHSEFRNFHAVLQPDGTFAINEKPFLRLSPVQVNAIYPDPDGLVTWFASNDGLIRYDTTVKKNYQQNFLTFVRNVLVNGKPAFERYKHHSPVIAYQDRNLGFVVAAPFFEAESETQYQYFLEGYDNGWSQWTSASQKDYTNLDSGSYRFRVRAKNVYEHLSPEDIFRFKVLPPWYKAWWAILSYWLMLILLVYGIVKLRSKKLEKEKQALEQIIKDRTKEIIHKSQQLEAQSEKLKEMDKVKSRFFANISHEFRTPLTLIMGPLEQKLSHCRDKLQEKELKMMLRNSQRLLTLINQLLDLSKLDSGKMQLHACRQNVIPFLKGLVGSFESLVVREKLGLTFHAEQADVTLYYDPEKLEKVICNLVANAVKFTPSRGNVTVSAKAYPGKDENYPSGYLQIKVQDTGVGIPADQLPYIFDRFYQADGTFSHEAKHKGTGIGLALVKELVELHHGEVSVHSTEGKGTEFTIRLPLGSDHLKPEEILDADQSPPTPVEAGKVPMYHMVEPEEIDDEVESKREEAQEINRDDREKDVILVVEDNPDVREYMREPLKSLYTVVEAADGEEGIDKAREIIPDLIVSDIMMPKIDGCQLCSVLKKDIKTSHIPIILLTAKASQESIIEGLETGADDYITKPFNTKILLTRIKNLIDLRRQLQEKIQREMMLQPTDIEVSSIDQEFMKELKEAIEKNLTDPDFGVDELAKVLYMGRATLNRKMRAFTGESTNNFIQSYRLKRAAQLLKANFGNVTEVAFEVGFSNSAYFTKCFKEKFQHLPSAFQASEAQ